MVLKPLKIRPLWYALLDSITTRPSLKNLHQAKRTRGSDFSVLAPCMASILNILTTQDQYHLLYVFVMLHHLCQNITYKTIILIIILEACLQRISLYGHV